MKSIFEEMGGTYTLGEDGMYYPDLELPVDEEPHFAKKKSSHTPKCMTAMQNHFYFCSFGK